MKKVLSALLLISTLLFSSCISMDPTAMLKANEQIKAFLDEHRNADMTVVKLQDTMIESENVKVEELCGIKLEPKEHYKVEIIDTSSNLELYAYMEIESQEMICLKKIGKETIKEESEEEKEQEKEENKEKEQEKEKTENKEKNEEKEEVAQECKNEIELKAKTDGDHTVLEWSKYPCDDFQGYKVVWSDSNNWPKYPEDGYLEYITDIDTTEFKEKSRDGSNHYSITVLAGHGKTYSLPVNLVIEKAEDVVEKMDEPEEEEEATEGYDAVLGHDIEDGKVVLEWNAYPNNDLQYYKIVWSQKNSDLMYPEDGYIKYITDKYSTRFEVPAENYKEGINYYRISVILNDFYPDKEESQRINSNVVEITKE